MDLNKHHEVGIFAFMKRSWNLDFLEKRMSLVYMFKPVGVM